MSAAVRVELTWPRHNVVVVGEQRYFGLERDGAVHLIASRCPHRGGPLHLGEVEGNGLRCPWHGNSFRVDRLCTRGVSTVQRGPHVIAYLPDGGADPVATNTMVLAQ
ncbi:hypothetical protein GCM10010174_18270 [Kutzneria viridogrisea]|uniref:Rieske domain-containing protein n=2 Tax=Kutzneria TaxID=43356 RepID=W5WFI0_9PSEU|nr:Rieske 2Fe-2S domain-containing protein [Kutzneria albida]AHH99597.1 hypothetical protein KALB_6237 [Kutzneria albida DSM 43870]MBA8922848.1 Rieske Fe-S protein [Kutzneria viridogrisea]